MFRLVRPGVVRLCLCPDPGDRALADDLVQGAFMAAARHWPAVRCLGRAQRRRWLQTTVGHLAISAFRRNAAFDDRLPRLEAVFRPAPADTHADAVAGIALERRPRQSSKRDSYFTQRTKFLFQELCHPERHRVSSARR